MTRRERLMATLRGEPVDRPAVNFYEIGGVFKDPADPDEFNVYNDPSWKPLLDLAEEKTDLIRTRSPIFKPHPAAKELAKDIYTVESYKENGSRFSRTTINIGGRTLTRLSRRDPDVDTVWTLEHLLKNADDLRAYLQLPDEILFAEPDVSNLVEEDKKLGSAGILMADTLDPVCAAAELFDMQEFTILAMTEQALFHRLLEKVGRPIQERVAKTAAAFPGHLWRIFGPEYCSEPYLPPSLFEEYVVRYTTPLVESIQKHGGFARIHCHGRLKNILPLIAKMNPSAIDPIEPPPQGDMELSDVRREYGKDWVLFGNIEIADIENMEPDKFEGIVAKSLKDGTAGEGRGFVLTPSAGPYGRTITARTMTNYETMVRLAEQFSC
jgi:Uroporphyrinogen decarboxylase (URO-D)